ncbi:MAG: hypothetical protein U0235_04895 [Polyangiaceae bacterium]
MYFDFASRALLASVFVFAAGCSSSSSSSGTPATPASDGGAADGGGTPPSSDAGATPQDASTTPTTGLTLSDATVTTINGNYPIEVFRITNGSSLAFSGNFDGKIEIEIDTDAAGAVKAAHVWSYKGTAPNLEPDKFYGCDGKATACTGVSVNTTTNVITITGVVWPEVTSPSFDGSGADTLVPSGAKVTVTANITAKTQ